MRRGQDIIDRYVLFTIKEGPFETKKLSEQDRFLGVGVRSSSSDTQKYLTSGLEVF